MPGIQLQTAAPFAPKVYAYSTPQIREHDGYLKIGYTTRADAEQRIREQGRTIDVVQVPEWVDSARFLGEPIAFFDDHDLRKYLYKLNYKQLGGTEYVRIGVDELKVHYGEFIRDRGIVPDEYGHPGVLEYKLRDEQEKAVHDTCEYAKAHPNGAYLWNAKPRFGKTLSTYELIRRLGARRVLIVTNRPAIANSWYDDYEKFLGRDSGYFFVSSVDALQGKPLLISHEEYEHDTATRAQQPGARPMGCIEFVSLQDLKGAIAFGGEYRKLEHIARTEWDLLVIDEAHEGVDTYRTDAAFERIRRKFTLHLSGTPFRALANDTFPDGAIFNWTYADEQAAKHNWSGEGANPYGALPKLNMYTYQMSEIVREEIAQGIEIDGDQREYAFDLNEFFATNGSGRFLHESAVDRFLDALTTQTKFPFSTPELRDEIRHSLWLLNRVDSARALAKKLEKHPVFSEYKVVLAAGDGRMDADDQTENAKSLEKVRKAIDENEYSITLSVGQLTTGVTVPEWTAVLMLSSIRSPSLYMQAAFRAQNPCTFKRGDEYLIKENAYVFDFDPARTLIIYDKFANDLSRRRVADTEERRQNIKWLLNFFPVLGEDERGEMVELDAEKVLSIPRRIKSQEVVKSGFMCNYLFTDAIGIVFHAPQEVIDIITSFVPADEPNKRAEITTDTARELDIDDEGEVRVPEEKVIGLDRQIFGEKIYGDKPEEIADIENIVPEAGKPLEKEERVMLREHITDNVVAQYVKPAIEKVKESFNGDFRKQDQKRAERRLTNQAVEIVAKHEASYAIEQKQLEQERDDKLTSAQTPQQREAVQQEYQRKSEEKRTEFIDTLNRRLEDFQTEAQVEAITQAVTGQEETAKREQESRLRDHLRGFSRTIPSFLMAYGNDSVTLASFDAIIPDEVFLEVTGINLAQFRKLRDGGEYEGDDGEIHSYPGLFDETVFNDSVKVFLRKRAELADYFDESHEEDIFDYIPPQRTNQIFTPRWVVRQMADALEAENPGCFDNPDATFADLYMKSGLYITEIVRRLYHSEGLKRAFPDEKARIRHIIQNQVYGIAPTQIIHRIAVNYILGFDETLKSETRNFVQADSADAARNGALGQLVKKLFG